MKNRRFGEKADDQTRQHFHCLLHDAKFMKIVNKLDFFCFLILSVFLHFFVGFFMGLTKRVAIDVLHFCLQIVCSRFSFGEMCCHDFMNEISLRHTCRSYDRVTRLVAI